jgi:hypothetical protein
MHNGLMPETPTASDLEKAHLILGEFGLLIGPAGEMSDVIGRTVAAALRLGLRCRRCGVKAFWRRASLGCWGRMFVGYRYVGGHAQVL